MTIKLIIGLGNPGEKYAKTRHNAGFWLLEDYFSAPFSFDKGFNAELAETSVAAHTLRLCKPLTFMNKSGDAVQKVLHFYKLTAEQILVVHDELDLPAGVAKLKMGGGHGGHNGLRDISAKLGTGDFLRLRIGIGHPGDKNAVVNYVLKSPSQAEKNLIDDALCRSAHSITYLLRDGLPAAMQYLHTES